MQSHGEYNFDNSPSHCLDYKCSTISTSSYVGLGPTQGKGCYCAATLGAANPVPDSYCSGNDGYECPGNSAIDCGADSFYRVYSLPAVSGLAVSTRTGGFMNVTWDRDFFSVSYQIIWKRANQIGYTATTTTHNYFELFGLIGNTNYDIVVTGIIELPAVYSAPKSMMALTDMYTSPKRPRRPRLVSKTSGQIVIEFAVPLDRGGAPLRLLELSVVGGVHNVSQRVINDIIEYTGEQIPDPVYLESDLEWVSYTLNDLDPATFYWFKTRVTVDRDDCIVQSPWSARAEITVCLWNLYPYNKR
jgi:hypothetical protein